MLRLSHLDDSDLGVALQTNYRGSLDAAFASERLPCSRLMAWKFLQDPARRNIWWPQTHIDFWRGGILFAELHVPDSEPTIFRGEVDVFIDGHALGFTWSSAHDEPQTSVLITLTSRRLSTEISVAEVGFSLETYRADRLNAIEHFWRQRFQALRALV